MVFKHLSRSQQLSLAALGLLALGVIAYAVFKPYKPTNPALGAGVPLNQSSTQIKLLEEPTGGLQINQTLSSTTHIEPAQPAAQPSENPAEQPATQPESPVVGPTPTGIQLGATLSLLMQAYTTGGAGARNMAGIALAQAEKIGDPTLYKAIAQLRDGTPRQGPTTLNLLMLESQRIAAMGVPENLPETKGAEPPSWFMKQISYFITIRKNDNSSNMWQKKLAEVQVEIARGNIADASITLEQSILSADERLDTLRSLTRSYLDQYGKVVNALNTYLTRILKTDSR